MPEGVANLAGNDLPPVPRVAAIAAHDPTQAAGAMQQHLRTAFAAIERIASAHAEFF